MPANDPKIVVYIAIDNPKGVNQYGGVIAGPPAKAILTDAIKALNIEKPEGGSEKKYQYTDKIYYEVVDVTNQSRSDAEKNLSKFNIVFEGEGDTVIYQSPEAGSKIYEGETVRLFTD